MKRPENTRRGKVAQQWCVRRPLQADAGAHIQDQRWQGLPLLHRPQALHHRKGHDITARPDLSWPSMDSQIQPWMSSFWNQRLQNREDQGDSKKCSKTGTEDAEKEPGPHQAGRHHVRFLAPGGRTVTREQKPQVDLPSNPRTSPQAAEGRTQSTGLGGPLAAPGRPADIPTGHRAACTLQGGLSIFTLRTDTSCLVGR